ncbi:hypothetical protein DJ483_23935, partial [Citrobacter freundii]
PWLQMTNMISYQGLVRTFLNRHEKYEVLDFLNALHGENGADLSIKTRQICEWMIRNYLPGTIQSTKAVESWIASNFDELSKKYPY